MIPSTSRRSPVYTGDGSTPTYSFGFKVYADADVKVQVTGTDGITSTLALSANYTVTRNADQDTFPGGSITLTAGNLTAGHKLVVIGNTSYSQSTQLPNGGAYNASIVEKALDRLAMQAQQLLEIAARALTLPATADGVDVALPSPSASALIGWNSGGTGLINYAGAANVPVSVAMSPVVQAATLALARAALGATTVGAAVFTAADEGAARVAIGVGQGTTGGAGLIELATTSETQTGTDSARAVTPSSMHASVLAGLGQVWTNVTRSIGTTYTNTTGRPIQVAIRVGSASGVLANFVVGGGANVQTYSNSGIDGTIFAIVPPGQTYVLTGASLLNSWVELR